MDSFGKAERASALLNDDLWREAIDGIRQRQHDAFANSAPDKPEAREQAYHMLMAVNQVELEIQRAIDDHDIQARKVRKRNGD